MRLSEDNSNSTAIIGGGLAGLAAAYALTRSGRQAEVFEAAPVVGGLSRTISVGEFLYDLGGHRFFTHDEEVDELVRDLMGDELVEVKRSSKIYLKEKFFDYPLKPLNAVAGLGIPTVARIGADYAYERLKCALNSRRPVSLEDWVVSNFGRTLFNIYFKEYSEKVWGLGCDRISEQWVSQRIQGLSLWGAVKNALFKVSGRKLPTLADSFVYPRLGIGRLAERLSEEVQTVNRVHTSSGVISIKRDGRKVRCIEVRTAGGETRHVRAGQYISTVPVNALLRMMEPAPPREVADAALRLRFRDLLLVAVMVNAERVTDQTWVYIPEERIPFGRIHEPKNWSEAMAPPGKTLVVVEYFCFRGDDTWSATDDELSAITVGGLRGLGFLDPADVIGTEVLRVPNAYPLFEVGFEKHCEVISDWLGEFGNLRTAGRSGQFKYHNMDHAIRSGIEAADQIIMKGLQSPIRAGSGSEEA